LTGWRAQRIVEGTIKDAVARPAFGDNTAARGLYRKLGYRETNVVMRKDLV